MATKQIAWTTGSGYITLTYNGLGNGTITVSSDDNTGVAREQIITIETTAGTPVVTKNITIRQEAYVPPILNFSYTGSVQSCTLPPGLYRLQCWGAQGGSNPSDTTYEIPSYDGGKGGYSEGILKLTSTTTVYIFVGGQPSTSSTDGGWNGGGGGSRTSTNGTPETATYGLGVSKVGRGGGATDIALVNSTMNYSSYRTNRSSSSLLSRFIVAGGGSGGAACLKRITTSTTSWTTIGTINGTMELNDTGTINGYTYTVVRKQIASGTAYFRIQFGTGVNPFSVGDKLKITFSDTSSTVSSRFYIIVGSTQTGVTDTATNSYELTWDYTVASNAALRFQFWKATSFYEGTVTFEKEITTSTTTDTYDSQVGYAGGGIEGDGYIISEGETYGGTQNSARVDAGFGFGKNQVSNNFRYVGAAGGSGWYGGGNNYGNNTGNTTAVHQSGGGSGFVNTPASASNRPQDYTGLELQQGFTIAGTSSFESTSGGSETGHEGNGYARISNLYAPEALLKCPLSFDILTSGTVVWKASNSSLTKTIQYRKNYGEWTSITSTTSGVSISVSAGDLLQFRGDNSAYGNSSYYNSFGGTADFNVWGNIMSLINSTSYATLTTLSSSYTFRALFMGNNHLLDATRLQLPATTLSTYCYYSLFYNCTYLVKGVKILPATTLANHCYRSMYSGCSSLERGSDILASSLVSYSLYYMHSNCTSLKYIKCLATSGINTSNSTTNFTNAVPAGGVFLKVSSASWPTGANGIPSGWDIIEG